MKTKEEAFKEYKESLDDSTGEEWLWKDFSAGWDAAMKQIKAEQPQPPQGRHIRNYLNICPLCHEKRIIGEACSNTNCIAFGF